MARTQCSWCRRVSPDRDGDGDGLHTEKVYCRETRWPNSILSGFIQLGIINIVAETTNLITQVLLPIPLYFGLHFSFKIRMKVYECTRL